MDSEQQDIYVKAAGCGFVDPISGLPPRDERSISALLCIFHNQGKINWSKVPLLGMDAQPTVDSASVLGQPGVLCSEYTLFWGNRVECDAYGDMRPDYLFIADSGETVAIVENKLGTGDTHKGDHYGGQFGRYIQYLKQAKAKDKFVILLTSNYFLSKPVPWYVDELRKAEQIQKSASSVCSRVIRWEDVLDAFSQ